MKQGKIFILTGPSAVGQGTIIRELLAMPDLNLCWSKAYTTRTRRPSDEIEDNYFFVSKEEFENLTRTGEIFEWTNYDGINCYGSSKRSTDQALNDGKNIIRDIDIIGARGYTKSYGKDRVVLIFVKAPIEIIRRRLIARGQNTPEDIEVRVNLAQKILLNEKYYDYSVENVEGKPEIAINKIARIIRKKSKE